MANKIMIDEPSGGTIEEFSVVGCNFVALGSYAPGNQSDSGRNHFDANGNIISYSINCTLS